MAEFEEEQIELFSNATHTLPHFNTAGNFINMLPEITNLDKQLEVGVKSISIPAAWIPFKEHATRAQWILVQKIQSYPPLIFEDANKKIRINNHVQFLGNNHNILLFTLLQGAYLTNEDILKKMLAQIREAFKNVTFKTPRFSIKIFSKNAGYAWIRDLKRNYFVLANEYLSEILDVRQRNISQGWLLHRFPNNVIKMSQLQSSYAIRVVGGRFQRLDNVYQDNANRNTLISYLDGIVLEHPIKHHSSYLIQKQDTRQYFQVFANFVKESVIDNERKPKLLSITLPSLAERAIKSTYDMIITAPHYIPVKNLSLNYLHVWITDEDGHTLEFKSNIATHISLHFRKQNPYK